MSKKNVAELYLTPLTAAFLLACGNVYAEGSSEIKELTTPSSSVSVGVGTVTSANDAKRFSQYTGLNQRSSVLLDGEFNKRDDVSGKWTIFSVRNFGLDTRELNFSQSKQGDWRYAIEYNEIVRRDPYVIHTGMTGIGSTSPTINLIANPALPASTGNWGAAKPTANAANNVTLYPNGYAPSNGIAGSDVELKLKRTALGLSGEKWISPELQVEVSFRNENKKGARMFGRAGLDSNDMQLRPVTTGKSPSGGWAILLTPEPIDSTIQQLEAKLNFTRNKLAITGGYYGSFYRNTNGSMSPVVPASLNRGDLWTTCSAAGAGCSSVQQLASAGIALPPDNQAHQLYMSGSYAFSDTTRSNFKASYTHATQNESFVGMGLTPSTAAPASLGGVVDTTLVQVGLTMRPMQNLSLNGNLRYEDRADKTPIYVYNTNGVTGSALNNTTNWPSGSQTRTSAKLDGIYRFPSGYSLMLGGDWERKAAPLPPSNTALFANQVLFRPVLNEYGFHTELRKALSATLNGAIGLEYKDRRGKDTDWVTTNGVTTTNPATSNTLVAFAPGATTTGNRVLPDMYMDRIRSKLRGNLDWEATDKLSLQVVIEHMQDSYKRAIPSIVPIQFVSVVAGARTIIGNSLSLESAYAISDDWRTNAYWTHSYNRWNVNKASLGDDTRNTSDTVGLGVNGKMTSRLDIGLDVFATRDTTTFTNVVATSNTPSLGNIAGFTTALPGNFLPNIHYRTRKINVHGKYALDNVSDVKVMFAYQQFKTDDWQWGYNGVPFLYSDNTSVSQQNQNLKFLGASYLLRF